MKQLFARITLVVLLVAFVVIVTIALGGKVWLYMAMMFAIIFGIVFVALVLDWLMRAAWGE